MQTGNRSADGEPVLTLDAQATAGTLFALDALERGQVLFFPTLAFQISEDEEHLLDPRFAGASKNISFDPRTGRVKGAEGSEQDVAAITAMMARYSAWAHDVMRSLCPHYADKLEIGRTSFRPVEIQGRAKSKRKDDSRLHVDAFPSVPTGGKRILRLFSNVNPDNKPREWRLGPPFDAVAERFLPHIPRQWPGASALMHALGITKARRCPYDHLMLGLHDAMKADDDFQAHADQIGFLFPPGSTWTVFTDRAAHAGMSGQHVFEQTFYLKVADMADESRAPLRRLEKMTGRKLA
jgi:3-deoxy-D-manno-oct-2-ulosonic acid (Kdo) hydroxylase